MLQLVWKNGGGEKIFPKIKDHVIIYPNSIIVGDITIGKNSIIGSGSFVNKSIPNNSFVYPKQELIINKNEKN